MKPKRVADGHERERLRGLTEKLTSELRTNTQEMWVRIRQLLTERGINLATSHLVQFHTEDTNSWLGIVVTAQARVFLFVYDFLGRDEGAGTLEKWQELTDATNDVEYQAFDDQIACGLAMARHDR